MDAPIDSAYDPDAKEARNILGLTLEQAKVLVGFFRDLHNLADEFDGSALGLDLAKSQDQPVGSKKSPWLWGPAGLPNLKELLSFFQKYSGTKGNWSNAMDLLQLAIDTIVTSNNHHTIDLKALFQRVANLARCPVKTRLQIQNTSVHIGFFSFARMLRDIFLRFVKEIHDSRLDRNKSSTKAIATKPEKLEVEETLKWYNDIVAPLKLLRETLDRAFVNISAQGTSGNFVLKGSDLQLDAPLNLSVPIPSTVLPPTPYTWNIETVGEKFIVELKHEETLMLLSLTNVTLKLLEKRSLEQRLNELLQVFRDQGGDTGNVEDFVKFAGREDEKVTNLLSASFALEPNKTDYIVDVVMNAKRGGVLKVGIEDFQLRCKLLDLFEQIKSLVSDNTTVAPSNSIRDPLQVAFRKLVPYIKSEKLMFSLHFALEILNSSAAKVQVPSKSKSTSRLSIGSSPSSPPQPPPPRREELLLSLFTLKGGQGPVFSIENDFNVLDLVDDVSAVLKSFKSQ